MNSTTIIELDSTPYYREFYFDFSKYFREQKEIECDFLITPYFVAREFAQFYTKCVNTEPSGTLLPCKKEGQYLFNTDDKKTANFLIKNKGFYMHTSSKYSNAVWVAANRKLGATERTVTIKGTKSGIFSTVSNTWFDDYISAHGKIVDPTEEVFLQQYCSQYKQGSRNPYTTSSLKSGFRTTIVDVHTPIPLDHKVQIKSEGKTIEVCFQIVYNENNPSAKKKAKTEITKKSTSPTVGSPEENLKGTKHLPLDEIPPPSGGTFPPSGAASSSSGKPLPQPPKPLSSGIGPSTTTSTAAAPAAESCVKSEESYATKVKNQRSPGSNAAATSSAASAAATTAAARAEVTLKNLDRSVVSHSVAAAASAAASTAANLTYDANERSENVFDCLKPGNEMINNTKVKIRRRKYLGIGRISF